MARFISLFDSFKPIGQFDLPEAVLGASGNRFRLVNAVGGGGNGVVFRAIPLGRLGEEIDHCAVKLLRQCDPSRRDRFSNEGRIMERLDHVRIAQLPNGRAERSRRSDLLRRRPTGIFAPGHPAPARGSASIKVQG